MTAEMGVVNGIWSLALIALGLRYITRPNFKPRYENALDVLNSVRREVKDEVAKRLDVENELSEVKSKCSGCFLDQAETRKYADDLETNLVALTADYGNLADAKGVVEQALATEKRSNAALRGQITRLTMKKTKAKAGIVLHASPELADHIAKGHHKKHHRAKKAVAA